MKIEFLPEPKLEFGVDRHIDIRFGLMNFGPIDYAHQLAPKEIRLGIVGTNESVEGVQNWLSRCKKEIPAKESKQPNLFPKFPGFRLDSGFQSTIIMDDRLQRPISQKLFEEQAGNKDINQMVIKSVDLFLSELSYLANNTNANVLMCAVPQILLNVTQNLGEQIGEMGEEEQSGDKLNFHHLLKAKAMVLKIPIQLIVPSTYDETKRKKRQRKGTFAEYRKPQDEATRAWNLHTALYYKARGVPWRLVRDAADFTTCYIGISFYQTLDGSSLLSSIAEVFNERGEGVVVRGGPAKLSKEDRQVHLEHHDAMQLLDTAIARYKQEHKNFPARVVIHKTSTFSSNEKNGFLQATRDHHIEMVDLVSITQSSTRLFRIGSYPPLRGTFLSLDDTRHILYTRGSVDFFSTYPGMYIPRPLLFRCEYTEQTPRFIAQEILALTKMNWNYYKSSAPGKLYT